MNKVELTGRIAQDAKVESTPSGYSYVNFSVAQDGIKYNPQTNANEVKAQYFDCQIKGKYAAEVGDMPKGTEVHLVGELTQDQWKDQQGNNRSKLRVNVVKMNVLVAGYPTASQSYTAPVSQPQDNTPQYAEDEAPF